MFSGKSCTAIIPARAGSKGLPGKNIKILAGRPLISWTIQAALDSPLIDRVIVSTDGDDIATIARDAGAEVPFLRPAHLATDEAKAMDVLFHAIRNALPDEKEDWIVLLQPTSPLRSAWHLSQAFDTLKDRNGRAVISVCETEHHPWLSNLLPEDRRMSRFLRTEVASMRRQELPTYFRLNGAIYIARRDYLLENNGFLGLQTFAYIMPQDKSVDIDTELDFSLASLLMEQSGEDHGL